MDMNEKKNINIEEQNCEYCEALFFPKRRWIQKYCCESCRTLACRERKAGEGGNLKNKKRIVSITDLSYQLQRQNELFVKQICENNNRVISLSFSVEESIKDLRNSMNESSHKQNMSQKKALNSLNDTLESMRIDSIKQTLSLQAVKQVLTNQQWVAILSSIFGPIIGQKIWKKGREKLIGCKNIDEKEMLKTILGLLKEAKEKK